MNLNVMVTKLLPEWTIVLDQIGCSYNEYLPGEELDPASSAVLIITENVSRMQRDAIKKYVADGGTVLTESNIAVQIFSKTRENPGDAVFDNNHDQTSRKSLSSTYKATLKTISGLGSNLPTSVFSYQKGKVVSLPPGLCKGLLDKQSVRKNFPSNGGSRYPNERVAFISKNTIRWIVFDALKFLFFFRKLPLVVKSPFPGEASSLFIFRIDTDRGAYAEVETLYNLLLKFNLKATWFVDTNTEPNVFDLFSKMKNQELSYHCYRHKIFKNPIKQAKDFSTGLSKLKKNGNTPPGYASPFGEWTEQLCKIVGELGFSYSSEFALDYDNLPFYPWLQDKFSSVLQIPVHPISMGRLNLARHSTEEMFQYFKDIIDQKTAWAEPVIIYHHPGQKLFNVIEKIFEYCVNLNITNISMQEYARFWIKRNNHIWKVNIKNEKLNIESNSSETINYLVLDPGGDNYIMDKSSVKKCDIQLNFDLNVFNKVNPKSLNKPNWRLYHNSLLWYYRKLKQ